MKSLEAATLLEGGRSKGFGDIAQSEISTKYNSNLKPKRLSNTILFYKYKLSLTLSMVRREVFINVAHTPVTSKNLFVNGCFSIHNDYQRQELKGGEAKVLAV